MASSTDLKKLYDVDVTEILNKMLCRANRMLKDKRIHFGEMMNTALNYTQRVG